MPDEADPVLEAVAVLRIAGIEVEPMEGHLEHWKIDDLVISGADVLRLARISNHTASSNGNSPSFGNTSLLSRAESDLFSVMTGDFLATTVVRTRARMRNGLNPTSRENLNITISILDGLEQRGLVERRSVKGASWWRRVGDG